MFGHHHRDEEFAAVSQAWHEQRPVLITGPPGIGKTALAREFATSIGRRPVWIIGIPAMTSTPLAAIAAAVPVDLAAGPEAMLDALRSRLDPSTMLIVESAQHLDAASAAVIAQVFRTLAGIGVLTATGDLDPVLEDVLRTAGARRISVAPLDLASTAAMVEERVDAPIATATAVHLHQITGGNPHLLTELIEDALVSGVFEPTDSGTWRLTGDLPVGDELRRIGAERLAEATIEQRRLCDLLSLCEPLPLSVVEYLGLRAGVGDSEGALVRRLGDVVVSGYGILTRLRRAELGGLQRQQLAGDLVDALGVVEAGPIARLHRTRLALEYRIPLDADSLAESAATAFLAGDLVLTEQLARSGLEQNAGLPAVLQLARASSAMGRSAKARAVLAEVDPDSLDESELADFAITAAINHIAGDGDHSGALAVLDKFEPRIPTPALRAGVVAVRSVANVHAGDQFAALAAARTAQRLGPGGTPWKALGEYIEAEVLRREGEVHRPETIVRTALDSAVSVAPLVGTGARRTLVQTLLAAGDLAGAARAVDDLLEATLLQHVSHAISCSTAALVDAACGRFAEARHHCEEALRSLDDDRTSLGRGTAMQLASICAAVDDVDGARRAVRLSERTTASEHGWPGINQRLASAFVRIAEGELVGPIAALRSAADDCRAAGQYSDAVTILHWAVRMGDAAAAADFLEVATVGEGPLITTQRAHAAAVRDSDASRLRTAAAGFEALGFLPAALDAVSQAIVAHRAAAESRRAEALLDHFTSLRSRCEQIMTPAVRHVLLGAVLSRREREVMTMMLAGWTTSMIAERLGLQVTTVRTVSRSARGKIAAGGD